MARLRFGLMRKCNTTLLSLYCLSLMGNSSRWAVWLGRYASGRVSEAPKGFLIPVRNTHRYQSDGYADCKSEEECKSKRKPDRTFDSKES